MVRVINCIELGMMMEFKPNKGQERALEVIKDWAQGKGDPLITLTGFAGTGKSTILSIVKSFIGSVAWTAMTGRAALRLSQAAGVEASTLHKILYQPPDQSRQGELEFKNLNVPTFKYLVIDEASMITPKIYEDLKTWNHYYKVRILFVGDSFQLPPVITDTAEDRKYGKPDFTIFGEVRNGAVLTEIMRSGDAIIDVATQIRTKHIIPTKSTGSYSFIQTNDPVEYAVNEYLADRDDHFCITWRNKIRMEGNNKIRTKLGYTHPLPEKDEPIIFFRNGQGVLNGQIELVEKMIPSHIIEGIVCYRVMLKDKRFILCSVNGKEDFMDGNQAYIKNWKAYLKEKRAKNIEDPIGISYGYFSTVHKFQGMEARRISVVLHEYDLKGAIFNKDTLLPDGSKVPFGIRFLYTSLTRAKDKVSLIIGK